MSTVSVALNDVEGARISPQTRDRIRTVAKSLGYVPNRLAQGLRRQRSGIVGFVGDRVATTPYAVRMILGAQQAFLEADQLMVLMDSGGDPDLEARQITTLREHQVNGIVYAAMYHRQLDRLPDALGTVPTVLLDAQVNDPAISWVVPDEVAGAKEAVTELLTHGHRRIGLVTNENDIPATRLRIRGYRAALKRAGVDVDPTLVSAGAPNTDGGYRAAHHLLDRSDRPTGLCCFNDLMAMGTYRAAAEVGLRIPRDLSIVGYDNMHPVVTGLAPGLTTVQLPHYEMGVWAAHQLLALTSTTPGRTKQARLRAPLVRRGSVTSPPNL
jgi:LacI family transcriptional regulator, galactose operon repressor